MNEIDNLVAKKDALTKKFVISMMELAKDAGKYEARLEDAKDKSPEEKNELFKTWVNLKFKATGEMISILYEMFDLTNQSIIAVINAVQEELDKK